MKKRSVVLLCLAATAGFFLFLFFQAASFAPPGISVHPMHRAVVEDARLDLNLADSRDLQQLQGIGPVLSEAILVWREEHGGFRSVDQLLEVPGIGEKTFAGIRNYVCTGGTVSHEDSGR